MKRKNRKVHADDVFGWVKVLHRAYPDQSGYARPRKCWRVRCECGHEFTVTEDSLKSGSVRMCRGCYGKIHKLDFTSIL